MGKPSYKQAIMLNYLRKFPNSTSRSVARKIYLENSKDFTFETALAMVHYYRGTSGDRMRAKLADKSLMKTPYSFKNPYELPRSDAKDPIIFTLPKQYKRILVLSDIHIPYHNIQALTVAINYGKEQDIDCIFINGDLIDFYQISRFDNVERRRNVAGELEVTRQFLRILHKEFPDAPLYLLKGNHDNRLEMYLAVHAPELLDMEENKLSVLLNGHFEKEEYIKEDYHIEVFDDTTLCKIGKLNITHGHLLLKGVFAPVNPARGAFMRAKASVLIGHTHKVSYHPETTLNGKVIGCYSTGCLCELNPTYSPFANNFMHGFAYVEVAENGNYRVKNVQMIEGMIIN